MTADVRSEPPAELIKTPMFEEEMEALAEPERRAVMKTLDRVRHGMQTLGVEKPWGLASDWMRWPAGSNSVVLRPMPPTEVAAAIGGEPRPGFLLVRVERAQDR